MMQVLRERTTQALLPIARRIVEPMLRLDIGDQIGFVRIAKRFARQWAAAAGLYQHPDTTATPPETAARPAPGNGTHAHAEPPPVPRTDQRPVTIYVTRRHSSCKTAKKILDGLGVQYTEIDLSDDEGERQRIYRETSDRTFPQIYIDGRRLGGFDDLVVAREEGRLNQLLYPTSGSA
jgi:glutaredoxin 3